MTTLHDTALNIAAYLLDLPPATVEDAFAEEVADVEQRIDAFVQQQAGSAHRDAAYWQSLAMLDMDEPEKENEAHD